MGGTVAKLAFLPPNPPNPINRNLPANARFFHLPTKKYHNHVPVLHIEKENSVYTLLFSHGNAEDVGACVDWMDFVSERLKTSVVCYDYPGYGVSNDPNVSAASVLPGEAYTYDAVENVYNYLVEQKGIAPNKIVVWGRSLGSGPTCHIASKYTVGGVILQSPLLSCVRVVMNTAVTLPIDIFATAIRFTRLKLLCLSSMEQQMKSFIIHMDKNCFLI